MSKLKLLRGNTVFTNFIFTHAMLASAGISCPHVFVCLSARHKSVFN